MENNPVYKDYTIDQFTPQDLEQLSPVDIEEYQEYLKVYQNPEEKQITNTEKGLARKMSALRSFYGYYHKHQYISNNPTLLVDMPKQHEKAIIRLDPDEVALLLDYVESCGSSLTGQAKVYYEKTKERDLAILTLLLGTGIRVSECVGLDLLDVDFKNNGITITRKGGNQMVVYFGPEVEQISQDIYGGKPQGCYSSPRSRERPLPLHPAPAHGCAGSGEYGEKICPPGDAGQEDHPHKLRSTYGTSLYKETGDIYLVADVLGHKDVNTTRKHYAAIDENRRRQAASAVRLREK